MNISSSFNDDSLIYNYIIPINQDVSIYYNKQLKIVDIKLNKYSEEDLIFEKVSLNKLKPIEIFYNINININIINDSILNLEKLFIKNKISICNIIVNSEIITYEFFEKIDKISELLVKYEVKYVIFLKTGCKVDEISSEKLKQRNIAIGLYCNNNLVNNILSLNKYRNKYLIINSINDLLDYELLDYFIKNDLTLNITGELDRDIYIPDNISDKISDKIYNPYNKNIQGVWNNSIENFKNMLYSNNKFKKTRYLNIFVDGSCTYINKHSPKFELDENLILENQIDNCNKCVVRYWCSNNLKYYNKKLCDVNITLIKKYILTTLENISN